MTIKALNQSPHTWITTQEAATCFCLDCPECEKVYSPERVQSRKCPACGARLADVGYSANGRKAKLKNLAAKNPAVTRLVTRVARDGSRRLHREWSRPVLMRTYQDERAARKEDEARIDAMLNGGPVNGPIPTTQLHLLPADQRLKKHQVDEARRNPRYYLAGGNKYQPTKITRAIDAHRCRETVAHSPDDLQAMLARAKARRQAKAKTVPVQRPRVAETAAAFLEREIPETGSIDLGKVLELAATEGISRKALRRAARNLGWLKRSEVNRGKWRWYRATQPAPGREQYKRPALERAIERLRELEREQPRLRQESTRLVTQRLVTSGFSQGTSYRAVEQWLKTVELSAAPAAIKGRRGRPLNPWTEAVQRFCYDMHQKSTKKLSAIKREAGKRFGDRAPKEDAIVTQYAQRFADRHSLPFVPRSGKAGLAEFAL